MKAYAGIGSRKTPRDVLSLMRQLAARLASLDWTLRTGGAEGADLAFEIGAGPGLVELYLPEPGFNIRMAHSAKLPRPRANGLQRPSERAYGIAADHHPAWQNCGENARQLHARNVHQVLGADCATPSKFVICWTPDAATIETSKATGGTGQAIRIAVAYGVPVFNLASAETVERLTAFVSSP